MTINWWTHRMIKPAHCDWLSQLLGCFCLSTPFILSFIICFFSLSIFLFCYLECALLCLSPLANVTKLTNKKQIENDDCGNYSNKPKQKQTVFKEGDIWQLQELVDLWPSWLPPVNWRHFPHLWIWTCWLLKEKGKPKQGRIQRGFVKGGGKVGGEGGVIPVHFQTKLSVEIVFSCPNELKLSYGCPKTLQLRKDD